MAFLTALWDRPIGSVCDEKEIYRISYRSECAAEELNFTFQ